METTGEELRFPVGGGDELRAFLTRPRGAAGPRPGVLVVHEVFGLDAFTRGVAGRFAREGYFALAPDLFSRGGVPGPESTPESPAPEWSLDEIRSAVAALPDRRAVTDLGAAAQWLASLRGVDPAKLAVVGFCMGGTLAYLFGCASDRVAAVVDFYGRIVYPELSAAKPVQPLEMALNLSAPLLGVFGEEDASIPGEHVALFEERMRQFAKTHEIKTYPRCGHGFMNSLRGAYREPEAEAAWSRALTFLREYMELD